MIYINVKSTLFRIFQNQLSSLELEFIIMRNKMFVKVCLFLVFASLFEGLPHSVELVGEQMFQGPFHQIKQSNRKLIFESDEGECIGKYVRDLIFYIRISVVLTILKLGWHSCLSELFKISNCSNATIYEDHLEM